MARIAQQTPTSPQVLVVMLLVILLLACAVRLLIGDEFLRAWSGYLALSICVVLLTFPFLCLRYVLREIEDAFASL